MPPPPDDTGNQPNPIIQIEVSPPPVPLLNKGNHNVDPRALTILPKFQGGASGSVSKLSRELPKYDPNRPLRSQLRMYGGKQALKGDNEKFWPPAILDSLVTREAVARELQTSDRCLSSTEASEMARRVLENGSNRLKKIFAILVLVERVDLLDHILNCRRRVCDGDLPLELVEFDDGEYGFYLDRSGKQELIDCCFRIPGKKLPSVVMEGFDKFQWQISVPVFGLNKDKTLKHWKLGPREILPWSEEENKLLLEAVPSYSGGFGTVKRVRIHPLCHEFHELLKQINVADGFFAIKSLKLEVKYSGQQEAERALGNFEVEVNALKRFSGMVHPHLVTLLGTFEQDGRYNLIFPWAECALDQYWEKNPRPDLEDIGLIRWVSRQCVGMMEAINIIHGTSGQKPTLLSPGDASDSKDRRYGRHGDIKAENILWYRSDPKDPFDRGILVLSDFGLAAMHSKKSRSMVPNNSLGYTPSYRPPECDIKDGKITRAFDIWTLGCLFLEMVCWLLRGLDGKQRFDAARMTTFVTGTNTDIFFDIKKSKSHNTGEFVFVLKEIVSKTISQLHDDPKCTEWMHDLLEIIENKMLVVQSGNTKRESSENLLRSLKNMNGRAEGDESYCLVGKPWNKFSAWRPPRGTLAQLNAAALKHVAQNPEHLREDAL